MIVWAPPALLPLLATVDGIDRLIPLHDGEPDVEFDVDVEVMELAFVFRSTIETIPCDVPYLSAPPAALPGSQPRVGLVWRCGDWEHDRSIEFDTLAPLLDVPGVTWCSLQLDRHPHETHARLVDISDRTIEGAAPASRRSIC